MKPNVIYLEINDIDTEPQISHKTEVDNTECCSLDTKRLMPTPTAVIATTNGKCVNNQIENKEILPFSLRSCIGNLPVLSKYNHQRLKDTHNPKDATTTE